MMMKCLRLCSHQSKIDAFSPQKNKLAQFPRTLSSPSPSPHSVMSGQVAELFSSEGFGSGPLFSKWTRDIRAAVNDGIIYFIIIFYPYLITATCGVLLSAAHRHWTWCPSNICSCLQEHNVLVTPPCPPDFSGGNNRFIWSILLICLAAEPVSIIQQVHVPWVCARQIKNLRRNCCSVAP